MELSGEEVRLMGEWRGKMAGGSCVPIWGRGANQ